MLLDAMPSLPRVPTELQRRVRALQVLRDPRGGLGQHDPGENFVAHLRGLLFGIGLCEHFRLWCGRFATYPVIHVCAHPSSRKLVVGRSHRQFTGRVLAALWLRTKP